MTARRPGVLLDRDGTIIIDHGYVGSVDRVEFIPGAIAAIAALNRAGVPVAVVTNQSGVARGRYGIDDVEQVHKHMIAEMERHGAHVDQWFFCPYHPDGTVSAFSRTSADRKPAPGMALAAATALDLDLTASWVVGDDRVDVGLAHAVGARALHIGRPGSLGPDIESYPDLATAVTVILRELGQPGAVSGAGIAPPRFPAHQFDRADTFGAGYVAELDRALDTVDPQALTDAAALLSEAYEREATVFACGNGGSASIANHLQCDHVKGVGNGTDLRNRVFSLSTNVELFSAIANDIGYEHVFEYQLSKLARPGDLLVAVSSSGRSPNIVRAIEWARANGLRAIALTGFEGGDARRLADVAVHVEATNYGVVEDAHQVVMHLLAQYIRQAKLEAHVVPHTVF